MKAASVAFFWHMHQPFYLDPVRGEVSMPWVRLHAVKSYYDMISLLEEFPDIRATFNLVPALITQIAAHNSGTIDDRYYECSRIPAEELMPEQKLFILRDFFQANWDTMIRPHKRYWDLMRQRGFRLDDITDGMVSSFNTQAYRDIQVWFNLAWCGYMARRRFPVLNELARKGRFFTEDEKAAVLAIHMEIMKELVQRYRSAHDAGRVELTTSPFYHPILPLLCDSEFARRSMPDVRLPQRFHHPEDAHDQIRRAVAFHGKEFGSPPKGMWPSEGSVCPEIIPLAAEAGIEWIATDEAILAHTLGAQNVYEHLYSAYRVGFGGADVDIIFRDRGLSDMVAYGYSRNKPAEAAADFMYRLGRIAGEYRTDGDEPIVPIILDGENAWENYIDGGEEFLSRIYEKLSAGEAIRTVTVGEFLRRHPHRRRLNTLYTGSWIGHNFDIWIGESEENDAWNVISSARKFLTQFQETHGHDAPGLDLAWEEFLAAEGSDWFWWYGPDFSTDNDPEFDRLFRMHVQNVFRAVGQEVPHELYRPLISEKEVPAALTPRSLVRPRIDGRVSDFFEWHGAGCYECSRGGRTFALGCRYLTHIYYGFDLTTLYLRFDVDAQSGIRPEDIAVSLVVYLRATQLHRLVMPLYLDLAEDRRFTLERSADGVEFKPLRSYDTLAWNRILELSIPFDDLELKPGENVEFFASLKNDRVEITRFPREGFLTFAVPGEDFEAEMWMV